MAATAPRTRIKIDPAALGLELETNLVATANVFTLAQEGAVDIWLDVPVAFVGPQDLYGSQHLGLVQALEDILLALVETCPRARIEVLSNGNAMLYAA